MRLYPTLPRCARPELFHKKSATADYLGVTDEVADFLYGLVRLTKPTVAIETGTHVGDSAEAIGKALKANGFGHLHSCDTNAVMIHQAGARLAELPVTLVQCTGVELIRVCAHMDFVFIDSGAPAVREDEVNLLNVFNVNPLGIVAMHDACEGYANLYAAFERRDWPHLIFPSIVGISVFQRPE